MMFEGRLRTPNYPANFLKLPPHPSPTPAPRRPAQVLSRALPALVHVVRRSASALEVESLVSVLIAGLGASASAARLVRRRGVSNSTCPLGRSGRLHCALGRCLDGVSEVVTVWAVVAESVREAFPRMFWRI